MASITITHPAGTTTFGPERPIRVGRGPDCDLQIDDDRVSRSPHFELVPSGDTWMLVDHSTGGTWFPDGRRVAGTLPLEGQVELRLGTQWDGPRVVLTVQVPVSAGSTVIGPVNQAGGATVTGAPAPPAAPPEPDYWAPHGHYDPQPVDAAAQAWPPAAAAYTPASPAYTPAAAPQFTPAAPVATGTPKKRTGLVVGIALAAVAALVLIGAAVVLLGGTGCPFDEPQVAKCAATEFDAARTFTEELNASQKAVDDIGKETGKLLDSGEFAQAGAVAQPGFEKIERHIKGMKNQVGALDDPEMREAATTLIRLHEQHLEAGHEWVGAIESGDLDALEALEPGEKQLLADINKAVKAWNDATDG